MSWRIYIDMDGVLADIEQGYREVWERDPDVRYPQSIPGLFVELRPLPGAIESVNRLRAHPRLDVWVASRPSIRNANSYAEKRLWIEKYYGLEFARRLILIPDKSLLRGDVLIDDMESGAGQDKFAGQLLVHRDWPTTEACIMRTLESI